MSDELPVTDPGFTSRRALLLGAGAAGATVVLAACGGDDGDGGDAGAPAPGDPTVAEPTGAPTSAGGGAAELVKASAVPVGGGTIIAAEKVVVTQPVANQFKAFSAICTHQRCPLSTVDAGTINCNCHQSKFSIEDGSVKGGPAKTPLPAVDINVQGDSITLA